MYGAKNGEAIYTVNWNEETKSMNLPRFLRLVSPKKSKKPKFVSFSGITGVLLFMAQRGL